MSEREAPGTGVPRRGVDHPHRPATVLGLVLYCRAVEAPRRYCRLKGCSRKDDVASASVEMAFVVQYTAVLYICSKKL